MSDQQMPYIITECRTRLIAKFPFFAVLLYERCKLLILQGDTPENSMWQGRPVETACTDGRTIVVNLKFFESLSLDERVFVLAHEIYHVMAMHPRRMKYYGANGLFGHEFSFELFNVAADAVINQCLVDDRIGKMPQIGVLFPNGVTDAKGNVHKVTGREKPEDVYEWLMRSSGKKGKGQGQGQPQDGDGQGGGSGSGAGQQAIAQQGGKGKADQDLVEPSTQADSEVSETEMKASIQSAANQAKSRGLMPAGLKQFIDDFLEPEVNWEEELRSSIMRCALPDSYTWSKPNRRKLVGGLYTPRRVGTHCGHVVAAIDTSGSVSDRELKAFLGELASILGDVRPSQLTIIWCDAQVDRVDVLEEPEELRELVRAQGVPGRGGTRFDPPFDYAMDNIDDAAFFIYLTDGYAPFDGTEGKVDCPVIWVMSTDVVAPHGKTIKIDASGRV